MKKLASIIFTLFFILILLNPNRLHAATTTCTFEFVSNPVSFDDSIVVFVEGLEVDTKYQIGTSFNNLSGNQTHITSNTNGRIEVLLDPPRNKVGIHILEVGKVGSFDDPCETTITVFDPASPPAPGTMPGAPGTATTPEECTTTDGSVGVPTAIGCLPTDVQSFVKTLLTRGISIGVGLAFMLMLYGAFVLITSAGNPENTKKGQEIITSAIVGLLFIIFSVFLLKVIGLDILNLPNFQIIK